MIFILETHYSGTQHLSHGVLRDLLGSCWKMCITAVAGYHGVEVETQVCEPGLSRYLQSVIFGSSRLKSGSVE